MSRAAILAAELDRRLRRSRFTPDARLTPAQLIAHADRSRWKAYLCSRQAGKTTLDAFELMHNAAVDSPGTDAVFIAPTLGQAKKIIWRELVSLNDALDDPGKVNATDHLISFPNGSTVQLRGVETRSDIEWFRGQRFSLVVIDEAQSIGAHLRELIYDVLRPTLMRFGGRVVLSGTVGLVAAGYWHDVATGKVPDWSVHTWYLTDNPFIPNAAHEMDDFARQLSAEMTRDEVARHGGAVEAGRQHPKYLREIACRWVREDSLLVYALDEDRTTFEVAPEGDPSGCVLSCDLGTRDATAIVSLKWWALDPAFYVTRETVRTGCDLDDVRGELEIAVAEDDPDRIVIDEGGLGLMIADTLRRRHGIPVEPAQKMAAGGVTGQMDLLNTDIRRGRVRCRRPSRFIDAAATMQWDPEALKTGRRVLLGHEPDVAASLRYGWFLAQQIHLWTPPVVLTYQAARWEALAERLGPAVDPDDPYANSGMSSDLAALAQS